MSCTIVSPALSIRTGDCWRDGDGPLQKISVAMDCLCQIVLNRKLLHKLEKWFKLSCHVKSEIAQKLIT
jgi:hypothetical protein